jgi:RNA-binding motif protein, X-linked 2
LSTKHNPRNRPDKPQQLGLGDQGSWHDDYKDSAYIFAGGIPYELTEGGIICVFSQYGEILDLNMPRDPETRKTKGFAFLKYDDQRSTVLAADNFNGAQLLGRMLWVD